MKFSELPNCCGFVVMQPDKEVPFLAKDSHGMVRKWSGWEIFSEIEITPDTEVQPVYLKKPSCEE